MSKTISNVQESKITRKNVFFHTLSHLIYMFITWLMVLLTPRIGSSADAGVFTIVMSVSNICSAIALCGLQTYIASDINRKFSDTQYFYFGLTTTFISFLLSLILCFSFGYHNNGMILPILMYYVFVSTNSITSIMNSSMIRIKKNYLFSYALIIKSIVVFALFVFTFYATKSLLIAFTVIASFSILYLIIVNYPILKIYTGESFKFSKAMYKPALVLLIILLPLLIYRLSFSGIVSFPKMVLEQNYSKELVGYYGSMSSISSVIQNVIAPMLAQFAPKLTEYYKKNKKKQFFKFSGQIVCFICLITLAAFICAIFLDKWLLNIIYPKDKGILEYAHFFKWIIAVSGLQAVVALLSVCMATVNNLKFLAIGSIVGILAMFATVYLLIPKYAMLGIIICVTISYILVMTIFLIIIIKQVIKQKTSKKEIKAK